ncbi:hypothetical protein [Sphingobium xenophagum]|uniref:Uncharacterized protein n=1 Tax=Sphingobium xenophagum TaxID=121428 RepID=A0A401J9C4_SPHXE|nr:hypothetical protein [Sphingobium xenophagum]GBH33184.1 hypothetical protein MBESOW_P4313 [Sphingobium xenophagum]
MPLSAAGKGWDAAAAKEVKKLVGRQMLPRKINDLNFFGCQSASTAPNSAKGDVCQNPFNVLILLCNFLAAPVRTVHYNYAFRRASLLRMSFANALARISRRAALSRRSGGGRIHPANR